MKYKIGDLVTIINEDAEVIAVENDTKRTKYDSTKIKMITGENAGKEFWVNGNDLKLK